MKIETIEQAHEVLGDAARFLQENEQSVVIAYSPTDDPATAGHMTVMGYASSAHMLQVIAALNSDPGVNQCLRDLVIGHLEGVHKKRASGDKE